MLKKVLFIGVLACAATSQAAVYKVTFTNGGNMPISPGVLYTSTNADADARVGVPSTAGFTKLCQTGMNTDRATELKATAAVKSVVMTDGPVFPGESRTFEITVDEKNIQGVHFETMYGKTKDVCGLITINRHALVSVKQHVVSSVTGNDRVVLSGSFTEPVVTANAEALCTDAMSGVDCLRALSSAQVGQKIRSFSGYLPSVLNYLEVRYGAEDALSLLVPTAGAIQYKVELKH